jgi:isoamylase
MLHGMLNAYWEPLTFELPVSAEQGWRRWIDTALEAPDDICPWESAPVVRQPTYEAQPRSVVLLVLALEGPRSLGSFPLMEQFPRSTEGESIVA